VIAVMFPGQGSQAVGMGRDLYEAYDVVRVTFDEAGRELGYDVAALCFEGPDEKLSRTEFTQPALVTLEVATLRLLQENDAYFDVAFGHSLGEYAALVATDALGFADAVRLVQVRGRAMTAAGAAQPGAMAAVLGLETEAVEALCDEVADVWPANYNCPGQIVVSGAPAAVAQLCERTAAGAKRCLPLDVSGAFHTPLVESAVDDLRPALAEAYFAEPSPPFFSTCTVDYEVEDFDLLLLRQMVSPVRFEQAARRLAGEGFDAFLEIGPGAVLSGLVKRTVEDVATVSAGDMESVQRVLAGWPQTEGRTA